MKAKSLLILLFFCISFACQQKQQDRIVVGSKNFTEQIILGEVVAQQIERTTGITVERKLNLGGSFICHKAIVAGDIDIYVEYTGTAYTAILKQNPQSDAQKVFAEVKAAYAKDFGLAVFDSLGFNNTFAILIRADEARRLGLHSISEAAKYAPSWKAGFGYEFMERKDGFPGLASTYGLQFAEAPRVMDLSLSYKALADKQVDLIAGNSTDGLIAKFDLFQLQDDRHYFPPYEAVPVVREETLKMHPQLEKALQQLSGKITEEEMRRMNYAVDAEHKDPAQVASDLIQ